MATSKPYRIGIFTLAGNPTPWMSAAFEEKINPRIPEFDAMILLIQDAYFSSDYGIGELLRLFHKHKDKNSVLVLVNPNEKTQRMFSLCKLDVVFTICDTEKEALKLCKTSREKTVTRFYIDAGKETTSRSFGSHAPTNISIPLSKLLEVRGSMKLSKDGLHYMIPKDTVEELLVYLQR